MKFISKHIIHHKWQLTSCSISEPHLPLPNPTSTCNTSSSVGYLFIKTHPCTVALPFVRENVAKGSYISSRCPGNLPQCRGTSAQIFKQCQLSKAASSFSELKNHLLMHIQVDNKAVVCSWNSDLGPDRTHEKRCVYRDALLGDSTLPLSLFLHGDSKAA